jgi:ABC-type nitrate/sulfonate/bicarbonate transport system ATPase subunit
MLELHELDLRYSGQLVLQKISLRLHAGQRIGLTGPSGAGKTSLLHLACGLVSPCAGQLRNSFQRMAMMFQEPRLLPWRSVEDNVVLPLMAAGLPRPQARRRAQFWIAQVELEPAIAQAWPHELSGGMAQRIALARALSLQPDLLLLDEPFSALDPALRQRMAALCASSAQQHSSAVICVSHHPQDLVQLVDRCYEVRQHKLRPQAFISPPSPHQGRPVQQPHPL